MRRLITVNKAHTPTRTWFAGNPADVHALTAEVAEPCLLGEHESSMGAFGPTPPVEKEPQMSYAIIASVVERQ